MQRTSFARMHCSLARGLELIGDWWSPLIIRDLFLGVRRFDELVEDLGISRNLLTTRLQSLATNGVVKRQAYQRRPMRYEYLLTEAGRDLVPAILALTAWGTAGLDPRRAVPCCSPTHTVGVDSSHRSPARHAEASSRPTPSGRLLDRAVPPKWAPRFSRGGCEHKRAAAWIQMGRAYPQFRT